MFHRDDNMSRFVPLFDIAVGLGCLFQRIASIYDCFDLSRLNTLFEENQIFCALRRQRTYHFFTAVYVRPEHLKQLFQLKAG